MKIDSDSPVANAENVATENGLSHDHSKSIDVAASPPSALPIANATNSTSATIWTVTSTYITPLVAVMPR